jgi:hypothetical protein
MRVLEHLGIQSFDAQSVRDWQRIQEGGHCLKQCRCELAFVLGRQRRDKANVHTVPQEMATGLQPPFLSRWSLAVVTQSLFFWNLCRVRGLAHGAIRR